MKAPEMFITYAYALVLEVVAGRSSFRNVFDGVFEL